jgi:hypothetical protein
VNRRLQGNVGTSSWFVVPSAVVVSRRIDSPFISKRARLNFESRKIEILDQGSVRFNLRNEAIHDLP